MKINTNLLTSLAAGVLAVVGSNAHGMAIAVTSLYDTPVPVADWSGPTATRSTGDLAPGGLTGNAQWATDFRVSWEITDNGNGTLSYVYTFTGFGSPNRDISNFVLDLSDDCTATSGCVTQARLNGQPIAADDIELGDKSGIFGAVKFDVGGGGPQLVYAFTSTRSPVWGYLAIKGGGGPRTCGSSSFATTNVICSNQLLGIGSPDDPVNFVARPNGVVPVPAAAWLFGSGLAALGWLRRRADVS